MLSALFNKHHTETFVGLRHNSRDRQDKAASSRHRVRPIQQTENDRRHREAQNSSLDLLSVEFLQGEVLLNFISLMGH